ncbi:uncharacterized protein LOC143623098 [Bidens hawaiensis]|uniref:uncharacterized protein LOC143623098 n=1 Tax=Bidens hawaiensis TaxID=980011 RepID=UPI00404AFC49
MMNAVRESAAKRQRGNTPTSELGRYRGANYGEGATVDDVRNLDILAWWKGKQNEFPILSAMSRDLLSIQASTVASESVFSLSGRILSMRRNQTHSRVLRDVHLPKGSFGRGGSYTRQGEL